MELGAGKVKIGFFSFTEVTDPAAHRAYNEWHQLDHMPEQFPLPGVAWGQRWVATPACRTARAVEGALLAPVHYVTLYLMADPVPETLERFAELGAELRAAGRFFAARRSHLSGPFALKGALAATRVAISATAVPYRPNTGVYVLVEEPSGGEAPDEVDDSSMLELRGVAGVWSFAGDGAGAVAGDQLARWRQGRYRITVCFLDSDPLAVAGEFERVLQERRSQCPELVPVFAGPFEAIVPWRWDWFDGG